MFQGEWLFLYELATYACDVGEIEEARTFLHGAFAVGDKKEIMKIAAQDRRLDSVCVRSLEYAQALFNQVSGPEFARIRLEIETVARRIRPANDYRERLRSVDEKT